MILYRFIDDGGCIVNRDWAKRIYDKYEDGELKKEYEVFKSILDVDNIEESILIEQLDELYPVLLEVIAERYISRIGQPGTVIQLCLNN